MFLVEKQIEELKKIMNNKLISLNKIIDYTAKQENALIDYDVDKLNSLIDLKQEQIDEIIKLDESFAQKFGILKKDLRVEDINQSVENLEGFKVIQVFIDEVNQTVSRIVDLEQYNSELGKEIQRHIKDSMNQTHKGKKISQGYNPHDNSSSMFFDKKK